jgi:hypothetical protein
VVSTVLSSPKLFADDTVLPALDPGRGRTKTGRLWCYAVDDRPWCGPGRRVQAAGPAAPRRVGAAGVLLGTPAAAVLRVLHRDEVAARRRSAGAHPRTLCHRGDIRGHPAEYRWQVRQERSRPIVEALHAWLCDHIERVSAASDLAKAIRYAIRHWPGLIVDLLRSSTLDDGRVEMDSNVVERAIRPVAVNRKSALFAGSDGGARHWAIATTLIQTAKLNGVDPMAWLTDVLERVVSGRTKANELHTLLPWNWHPTPKPEAAEPRFAAAA